MIGWLLKLVTGNPVSLLWIGGGIFAAGLAIGGGGAWTVQGWRLAAAVAKHEAFVAKVNAIGKAQEAAAKIKDAQNVTRMETANADRAKKARDLDRMYAEYQRMRDQRARGSLLPSAPAGAASSAIASFDRAGIDRALSEFDQGVTGLIKRGDEAIADLDTAKRWAQSGTGTAPK